MRLSKFSIFLLLPVFLFMSKGFAYERGCPGQDCCFDICQKWYGVVGAGYAFSTKAGIKNPDPSEWDPAYEGYDATLGNSPFFTIGLGRTFCGWLDFDLTYSYYPSFFYQKYQSGPQAEVPGFTGTHRMRFFDLDHQNVMFDFTIDPVSCFSCYCCYGTLRPILGAGVGVGINRVNNFHTTASWVGELPGGQKMGGGTTTTIGLPVTHASVASQFLAAIRFSCECVPLSFDLGYRYYYGGRFHGPASNMINDVEYNGAISTGSFWKGSLKANEIYLSLNWGI